MVTRTAVGEQVSAAPDVRPLAGAALTWLVVALSGLVVFGLFFDGQAHAQQRLDVALFGPPDLARAYAPPGLPTTLAVAHVPYLAGLLLMTGVLGWTLATQRARGVAWSRALPAGYWPVVAGLGLIAAGVASEVLWPLNLRSAMQRELGTSALGSLLSPQRLLHLMGLALVITGPLGAAWVRRDEPRRAPASLDVVFSLTFLLSLATYATQFAHPLVDPWPSRAYGWRYLVGYRYNEFLLGESLGVLSVLLQSALLAGIVLLAVRRWVLRPGSLTIMFTVNALLMAWLERYWGLVLVGAAAGIVADVLLGRLRRLPPRALEMRLLAFAVPAVYYLFYFLALARLAGISPSWGTAIRLATPQPLLGIAWNAQIIAGSVLAAGLVGWLVSLLVLPPGPPLDRPG